MPPRRTHTKSRNGCDQCKKRRVKCDEQGPPCANCVSRELPCSYLNATRSVAASSPASPATPVAYGHGQHALPIHGHGHGHSTVPSPDTTTTTTVLHPTIPLPSARPTTTGPVDPSRRWDLELMHKFSTETYESLCNRPIDRQTWQIILPRKALSHDFLMSGLLAVAALHTAATSEPPEALTYFDAALEYHNRAFTPFRHAIDNISPHNCDAVFAHSIITTVVGIALPRLTAVRGERSSMTENIVIVFELLQGVSNIFRIGRSWFQTTLYTHSKFFDDSECELEGGTEEALERLQKINDRIMAPVNAEEHRMIKEALHLLHRCFCRYQLSKDVASVLAWLAAVDKEFAHALRRRQPIALLALVHWAVLLGNLDGKYWWAQKSGTALASELLVVLQPGDSLWEAARLWPKEKLGL